jgi:Ca2+-binding RTX toxin-like protein
MATVIQLDDLSASQGFAIYGDADIDGFAGYSVSSAGDVNGDGIDDLIIGNYEYSFDPVELGRAYVVFGTASATRADIDLGNLDPADGFTIVGQWPDGLTGFSVSDAGDINGDGIGDLIVGAPNGGGTYEGEAYVVFGKAGATRADIDLTNLAASDGFVIGGVESFSRAGYSVSSAGDVNGDGIDDLLVGAPGYDGFYYSVADKAYVVFGKAGAARDDIDLANLAASDGFVIQSSTSYDAVGFSISGAGDVNGDGLADLVVGAPLGGGDDAGEVHVIFGQAAATRSNIDLGNLAAADGFTIVGNNPGDALGISVSSAGDVNGDGIDDLIAGTPFASGVGAYGGEAYVVYGKAGATRSDIDTSTLAASDGFAIVGGNGVTFAGFSVSGAGDIDGDGLDDLIVGSPYATLYHGGAFVIFGESGTARDAIFLNGLQPSDGFFLDGGLYDYAGSSVSAAGDINGDGFGDVIVGAPYDLGSRGEAFVVYGSAAFDPDPPSIHTGTSGNDTILGTIWTDIADGGGGDDTILGGIGADSLTGGTGIDTFYGGAGNDTFFLDNAAELVFEAADQGTDTVSTSANHYLFANVERLVLTGGANLFGVGNGLANTITGNTGANLLLGGAGDDRVNGGAGDDLLFGESGNDALNGDAGIDYIAGGIGNDFLSGGADADNLFGEDGADYLDGGTSFHTDIMTGGAGDDTLYGISGQANPDQDLMDGGSGNDTYWVDTGADLTFEGLGGGTDTVHANVTVVNAGVYLYANVENLVLEGTTAFGVGNELNNQLTGSASGNWLLGGAGYDRITGAGGNDVLFGEGGADTFVFGAGSGKDVIGDFAIAQDVIEFSAYFTSFAQAQGNFVQVGADGAIDLGNGNLVVLHGVTMANLTAANFSFVSAAETPKAAAPLALDPLDAFAAGRFDDWHTELQLQSLA